MLSDVGRFVFRLAFPIPGVRDYTCCFRAYAIGPLAPGQLVYGDELCTPRGFEAMVDLLLRLRQVGMRAAEVPLRPRLRHRASAQSKMRVWRTIRSTLGLLAHAARRPLHAGTPPRMSRRSSARQPAVKIAVIVGTRPEIVKMAPMMRASHAAGHEYRRDSHWPALLAEDDGMFFERARPATPDHNLDVGSGSQPFQIGAVLLRLEDVLSR